MVSRWALDSNMFPFVFLLATVLLARSVTRPGNLIGAAILYALALYAYGTAYLVVPVFAGLVLAHGLYHRRWPAGTLLASAGVFAVTALPVALYVAINSLGWRSISTAMLSIPRLTGVPRFQTMGNVHLLSAEFLPKAGANLGDAARMLVQQDDGLIWNAIPGYGILFPLSTFLALAGLALLVEGTMRRPAAPSFPLLAWCLAAVALMVFVSPNINRVNIAMLPFIYCVAVALSALWHYRAITVTVGLVCAGSLLGFVGNYFGPYRDAAAEPFFASFGESIRHASAQTEGDICVTGRVNMPYIFVLFYNREDPRQFAETVKIDNPGAEFQDVTAFGRYRFGLDRCAETAWVIVATHDEAARFPADRFLSKRFERFTVLTRTD